MFAQEEKYDALNKILKSKTFSKATTNKVLLKFLVESTLQDKEISATSIGIELFGNKYSPEKSDVNVRVNISHLRKRLAKYYEQEGANDPVIVSIEPGQYKATFSTREQSSNNNSRQKVFGVSIILIAIFGFLFWFFNKPEDNVWEPMFNNGIETTLYLGDVYGYTGPNDFGAKGWHRESSINSDDDFYAAIQQDPEKYTNLKPGDFTYVVFENSFNIKPFTQYFTLNDFDFSIRPASGFKIRAIKDKNTIYAGPIFTKHPYNNLFNDFANNVRLIYKPQTKTPLQFSFTNHDGKQETINLNSKYKVGEYAIASAFNGSDNTRHYMFFSNHGMGLTAAIEYFTNPNTLEEFSKTHLNESDEFVALFFVKGKDRTSLSTEIVYIDDNRKH